MISTFELKNLVYNYLISSPLKGEISGRICKRRPLNSEKEDVVINVLFISKDSVQDSIFNVNIYVPDLPLKIDGKQQMMPNYERLEYLTKEAWPILERHASENWIMFVINQTEGEEKEIHQHFVNFRMGFRYHNVKKVK